MQQHIGPFLCAGSKSTDRVLGGFEQTAAMGAHENRALKERICSEQAKPKDDHAFMITVSVA